jgi:hypothetical protein
MARSTLVAALVLTVLLATAAGGYSSRAATPQAKRALPGSPTFVISGRGWGHGVGMAQWGAYGFAQHGASRAGPHYLRFLVREGADGARFLKGALAAAGDDALSAGILAPVRTYESTGRQAAEATGFEAVGQVSMLVREVRASVRQPAMVPAV